MRANLNHNETGEPQLRLARLVVVHRCGALRGVIAPRSV